jgi:hypothetical protein
MALSHSPSIVTNGLVLCLDAANPKSYPGTGTTWFDLSGNVNNGTIYSGVEFSENGFTADAIGEGIKVNFSQPTKWTLSLWFRKNSTGTSYSRIAGSGPNIDSGEIAINGNTIAVNGPLGGWSSTSGSILNGETINLVACFDTETTVSNNTFLYKNSTNIFTATQTILETRPTSYMFMARNDFSSEWLPSTLYTASLYNRVLSPDEIQQNFNALRGRYGI